MTTKDIIKYASCIIIGFIIGILVNIPSCQKQSDIQIKYIEKTDTVVKTEVEIQEKTKIKYINKIDTFYIVQNVDSNKTDTVYLKDLPIEHKQYNDTVLLQDSAQVKVDIKYSGFNASIDSLNLELQSYNQIQTITKPAKKFGWDITVGPSVGYGISFPQGGKYIHSPFIGVTLTIGPSFRISK